MKAKKQTLSTPIQYTEETLQKLHEYLYSILGEVVRVCDKLQIPYFLVGGSALGAYFWDGIIPWDDDVDVGFTRDNYNRFLKEAPAELGEQYFLQTMESDPHYPNVLSKLRLKNTLFVEKYYEGFDMHHGIFVDIIPFDKVPSDKEKEREQRNWMVRIRYWLVGKEMFKWAKPDTCIMGYYTRKVGFLRCLLSFLVVHLVPRRFLVKKILRVQTQYNNCEDCTRYRVIWTKNDYMLPEWLANLKEAKFGPLMVKVPGDLETYLNMHYPQGLQKWLPEDQRPTHGPVALSFDTTADS